LQVDYPGRLHSDTGSEWLCLMPFICFICVNIKLTSDPLCLIVSVSVSGAAKWDCQHGI